MGGDGSLLLLYLLDILKKHTDEEHGLTQAQLLDILEESYQLKVARKTIKENMERLLFYVEQYTEDELRYDTEERHYQKENKTYVTKTNFKYVPSLTNGQLRLLIDGILFSKKIPSSHRKELINELEKLSSKYFHSRVNHISMASKDGPINYEMFTTIEFLDEAISNQQQVSFHYNKYQVDEKGQLRLLPQVDREGQPRTYLINPYHIVTANGHYYLICNFDPYDNLSHYRLDRISNIQVLSSRQKPIRKIEGQQYGLDLQKHMAEHIYMFRGASAYTKLRFHKSLLSDFIDWFGTQDIHFSDQTADEVTASVSVNQMAMRRWALQYATNVRVLSPQSLVEDIREDIQKAFENYRPDEV